MRPRRTSLVSLTYASQLNLAGDEPTRARQIGAIARHGQKRNEFAVLTSLLLIDGPFAVQTLEGEWGPVDETFRRIAADARHRDVRIVEWREIGRRRLVAAFASHTRCGHNEAAFQAAGLLPMLQRGWPRAGAVHALAHALQAGAGARPGDAAPARPAA